jgi:hypothetical protein
LKSLIGIQMLSDEEIALGVLTRMKKLATIRAECQTLTHGASFSDDAYWECFTEERTAGADLHNYIETQVHLMSKGTPSGT